MTTEIKQWYCGGDHCVGKGDMCCPGCVGADEPEVKDTRPRCPDCGEPGEIKGHMSCQYPKD